MEELRIISNGMNQQIPSEMDRRRENAMLALIHAGVRVPTKRQIAAYILTGKVIKDER